MSESRNVRIFTENDMECRSESRAELQFWYDFASTYSYLSAMRIEELGRAAGVAIAWRPFLLGPIFQAQGWATSPFNLYPAKGRYMSRDMQRIAAARGLAFGLPTPFPQHSVLAARVALIGCEEGFIAAFTKATYLAEFAKGEDISHTEVLAGILDSIGVDSARILAETQLPKIKNWLKAQTDAAQTLGIFGAPAFYTSDGELFWGDDRLDAAMAWAARL